MGECELGTWKRCIGGVSWQGGKSGRIVRWHGQRGGNVMMRQFGRGGRVVKVGGGSERWEGNGKWDGI